MEMIKNAWNYLKTKEIKWADAASCMPLLPGLFLAMLGLSALYAQEYLLVIVCAFCVVLGVALMAFAWKVAQLFGKIKKISNDFEARVYVQGFNVRGAGSEFEPTGPQSSEQKKIVYH